MVSRTYLQRYILSNKIDDIYYQMFFNSGKMLDIGCATGNVLFHSKNGIGVDIDKRLLKIAKKRHLNVKHFDCNNKLPFKSNYFEEINCRHIIEHINPERVLFFMKELRRVLKKEGRLVLMTPDIKRDKEHFWSDYTHKKPLNKEALSMLIYDAGFNNFKIYNFAEGFPLARVFYERNMMPISIIKIIKRFAGMLYGKTLVCEAIK